MSSVMCLCCLKEIEDSLICGYCRYANYCSKQCQIEHWPARKNLCIDGNIDNMQLFFRESHQDKNNEAPLVCRQCLDENQLLLEENRFHRKQGKLDETIVLFKNYIDDRHSIGDLKTISSMNVSLIAC